MFHAMAAQLAQLQAMADAARYEAEAERLYDDRATAGMSPAERHRYFEGKAAQKELIRERRLREREVEALEEIAGLRGNPPCRSLESGAVGFGLGFLIGSL